MLSWQNYFQAAMQAARDAAIERRRWPNRSRCATACTRDRSQELINFGSNDYLGLRHHTQLLEAARTDLARHGTGAGASPLVTGYSDTHAELEACLARWLGTEAALVFTSGYAANAGILPALAGEGDWILSDQLNHASLIDGCRLSRAERSIYRHADADHVRRELQAGRHRYQRGLIVTESIFSMDGDAAPLAALTAIAEQYDMGLVVDEAHASGVFGQSGAGLGEETGTAAGWLVKSGTLSKALGCCGGYVAGSQLLIDFLVQHTRSYIFSTAMPASTARAAIAAIELMPTLSSVRQQLRLASHELRTTLQQQGWQVPAGQSPIVPVLLGSATQALQLSAELANRGCLVPAIRPPTVPAGTSRLRISLSAAHTPQQLAGLVAAMADLRGNFAAPAV
jgi:8-amino-7-oxononanoate synthase